MGREIKRVPLDFNWPLGEKWEGYVPPRDGKGECRSCLVEGRSTGYSRLGRGFYALGTYAPLMASHSRDLTKADRKFMMALEKSTQVKRHRSKDPFIFGGDLVDNRRLSYRLMKHLARSLKLPFSLFFCPDCKGDGRVVEDTAQHKLHKKFRRKGPPEGEGWQVWETVSEGSPITPVFPTAEELVEHLCTVGTVWDQKNAQDFPYEGLRLPTREQAEAFVKSGWVPSMVMVKKADGTVKSYLDIEAAELQDGAE